MSTVIARQPPDMEQTARHEAAHAVLAHMTGVYLVHSIDLRGERTAVAVLDRHGPLCAARVRDNGGREIDHAFELGIICAAGMEAERRWLIQTGAEIDEDALLIGAIGDRKTVHAELGATRWSEVRARAADFISQPEIWSVIDELSRALLARGGYMDAHQVDALLHVACLDLPEWQVLK